jgi:hypothetical protein
MTTEQHPWNNTLLTQHLATNSRVFNNDRRQHCRLWQYGINLGLDLLSLNMDSWIFCLMKSFPEFLNLEYPILLGRHDVDLWTVTDPSEEQSFSIFRVRQSRNLFLLDLTPVYFQLITYISTRGLCSTVSTLQSNMFPILNASLGTVSRTTISFYFIFLNNMNTDNYVPVIYSRGLKNMSQSCVLLFMTIL